MARILLADDNPSARQILQRSLEGDGHQVEPVDDGSEALEQLSAKSGKFDLLITDVQMPGVDGITLVKQMRAAQSVLPVLLMSGLPEALEKARALRLSNVSIVAKPFQLDHVKAEVRRLLGK